MFLSAESTVSYVYVNTRLAEGGLRPSPLSLRMRTAMMFAFFATPNVLPAAVPAVARKLAAGSRWWSLSRVHLQT